MSNNKDLLNNNIGNKIDFLSFLKRRKRTVEQTLAEHNINTVSDLEILFTELSKEFLVSENFINEAKKILTERSAVVETIEEKDSSTEEEVVVSSEPKAKKRSSKKED